MITAEQLKTLTSFTATALNMLTGEMYYSARFLGITNAGQFCYMVTFQVKGGTDSKKIFLDYDAGEAKISVDTADGWHYN